MTIYVHKKAVWSFSKVAGSRGQASKKRVAETRDRDVARLVVLLASFFRGFESGLYIFTHRVY